MSCFDVFNFITRDVLKTFSKLICFYQKTRLYVMKIIQENIANNEHLDEAQTNYISCP